MKAVVIHHHMKPGGVTRIIESQLKALAPREQPKQVILATGEPPQDFSVLADEVNVFEELNYLTDDSELKRRLHRLKLFMMKFSKDVIFHVHNLNLGKNPLLTYAVCLEARNGRRVLNHCHDFAEDRPVNYDFLRHIIEVGFGESLKNVMYPDLPNYRMAVINQFDRDRLSDYGVAPERVELLENPVVLPTYDKLLPEQIRQIRKEFNAENKKLMVYPVRGIRRKNLGEFILLATLFSTESEWVTTLPPQNPDEITEYRAWKRFCNDNGIRIHFEAGEKFPFASIMQSADRCVSTSIKEGFGMAFLEPWLFGKPVVGRKLDQVCQDFAGYGIKFPVLYEKLEVGPGRDFIDLTLEEKMAFILEVRDNPDRRMDFRGANPQLELIWADVSEELLENNIESIKNNYSLKSYGDKLYAVYKKFS